MQDSDGKPIITENCRLMRSMITGRYIIFDEGKPNDKEITDIRDPSFNTLTAKFENYIPYSFDSDFSLFWSHSHDMLQEDIVIIQTNEEQSLDKYKVSISIYMNEADILDKN